MDMLEADTWHRLRIDITGPTTVESTALVDGYFRTDVTVRDPSGKRLGDHVRFVDAKRARV